MNDYARLQTLMRATRPLNESGEGGAHTDVLKFDADLLERTLAKRVPKGGLTRQHERLIESLSEHYLVKKGKIDYFTMPLVGKGPNALRRSVLSWAFGRAGYNFMPSFEKTLIDATEAIRLVPYFGYGNAQRFFAPDFVSWLGAEEGSRDHENTQGTFLRAILRDVDSRWSAFELLGRDDYFHARADSHETLHDFQRFVRHNPFVPEMEEKLADFFEGPITVGIRDTLRWTQGSRHPRMSWEKARSLMEGCFDRHGHESFVLPEINYYTYDTSFSAEHVSAIDRRNQVAAQAFSESVRDALPTHLLVHWLEHGDARLAYELLDFHHDYPLYPIEPYSGFVSTMMVRLLARVAVALTIEAADLGAPEVRNYDVQRLPSYHKGIWALMAGLGHDEREQAIEILADVLAAYQRHGLHDHSGQRLEFERIPRTFYNFQQRANVPAPGRRFVAMHSLEDLWKPEHAHVWQRYPELSEKLVVFYTQVYRYFLETGFVPDLRPRNAGRDIFVYGIWGYVTENLLIIEEVDESGRPQIRAVFVDNRDQFKQYRRNEDRRNPLGAAKYALRLIYPVVEPAMQRSIGTFVGRVNETHVDESTPVEPASPSLAVLDHGADVTRKVVQASVDGSFTSAKAAVDDLVDDAHSGVKRVIAGATRGVGRVKRKLRGR